jgi:hypothetical protein
MSREIETKKKLKIRLQDGNVISYESIKDLFKNKMKCNIFNSNIKIHINQKCSPSFYMELNCNVNKQLSTDLLLNEIPYFFNKYYITKLKDEKHIFLSAELYLRELSNIIKNEKFPNIDEFFEKSLKEDNVKSWISIFVDDKELLIEDLLKIILSLNSNKEKIEIQNIVIDNFKEFSFECSEGWKCVLDYEQIKKYVN